MKRWIMPVTALVLLLSLAFNLHAQTENEEVWKIYSVKPTIGPSVKDIRVKKNLLPIRSILKDQTLSMGDVNTFTLSNMQTTNDGFVHRREFRFTDKYNQTGRLILHEDPTAIDREEQYLIFILYDGKNEGRVFVSLAPASNNDEMESGLELLQPAEKPVTATPKTETEETVTRTKSDTVRPQAATEIVQKYTLESRSSFRTELKAGHASGNVSEGPSERNTNYTLKGRKVVGSLVRPCYASKASGTVVVSIRVDEKGNVIEATAGAKGTNVTDKSLWDASVKAAKKTKFSPKADSAPQWGTITYVYQID